MDSSVKIIEKRTDKIAKWFKDPYNLGLILILILAFTVRIYYFIVTIDQALWFDGLAYGSMAKTHFLTGVWSGYPTGVISEILIRPPILPAIWMVLIDLNFSEAASKFIIEFIPSVLSIFLVYVIGKEIYNKKIALIAAFVLAISWMHIFYTMRFLTHIPALALSLISMYYFFKSIEGSEIRQKYFMLAILFISLATLMRFPFGILGMSYIIFLISIKGTKLLKDKSFWKGGIIGASPVIAFFVINLILFGHIFPSIGITNLTKEEQTANAYYAFGFFDHILQGPFYWLFLLGIVVILANLFLGFGYIRKSKKLRFDLFIIILIMVNLIFLIFWIRVVEDRYLFENYITIIFAVAIGTMMLFNFVSKHHKILGIIFISGILIWGAYAQVTYGNGIINNSKNSFYQLKEAFVWLNENAPPPGSEIFGHSTEYYTIYYADKLLPLTLPKEEPSTYDIFMDGLGLLPDNWPNQGFDNYELTAEYIVISAFHPSPKYVTDYLDGLQENLVPVYVKYFDEEQQNPSVIIYKYNKNPV